MESSLTMLLATALTLGFVHTITGPDHYLPFAAISKTRNWSMAKTMWVVGVCGLGHVLGSIAIGLVGIGAGIFVGKLEFFEGVRGSLASWLLFSAGVVYTIWAIVHRIIHRNHTHSHGHSPLEKNQSVTFWVLFAIFVFGPCEPLIPLLMYPAAEMNTYAIVMVSLLFSLATIGTMMATTYLMIKGISLVRFHRLESYQHILAGLTLLISGAGIIFMGL